MMRCMEEIESGWWWSMTWMKMMDSMGWLGRPGYDLIELGFSLIWWETLGYCKQANIWFEWKSNVKDNAPMSKVEDVMKIGIRRRREWN